MRYRRLALAALLVAGLLPAAQVLLACEQMEERASVTACDPSGAPDCMEATDCADHAQPITAGAVADCCAAGPQAIARAFPGPSGKDRNPSPDPPQPAPLPGKPDHFPADSGSDKLHESFIHPPPTTGSDTYLLTLRLRI